MTMRGLILSVLWALSVIMLTGGCLKEGHSEALELHGLDNGQVISGIEALHTLKAARLVLIGEHHTSEPHHRDQLRIIRFLDRTGVPLSIGLEMFRKDQQEILDRWIAGEIDEAGSDHALKTMGTGLLSVCRAPQMRGAGCADVPGCTSNTRAQSRGGAL